MTTLELIRSNKELRDVIHEMLRDTHAIYNSKVKTEISQREAYRKYKESRVKVWVQRGLVTPVKVKDGNSKITYNTMDLVLADVSEREAMK